MAEFREHMPEQKPQDHERRGECEHEYADHFGEKTNRDQQHSAACLQDQFQPSPACRAFPASFTRASKAGRDGFKD